MELAYDRYRLQSDLLHLRRDGTAMVFEGEVRAAFCPCPDPPLTLVAAGGRIEPPGDLILRFPRIAVAGVPVFALPWLWIRAPDQVGILPPLVALRGTDGLLLGSGVHLPWHEPGGGIEALDLLAGGYTTGGAELGARLQTSGSVSSVTADLVHGTRVALDGHGALASGDGGTGAAFALDAIRGDRARSGTVELGAAARPFDTGAAEVSLHGGTGGTSAIVAGGVEARAFRGQGAAAAGPRTALALGGPLGTLGSWSAGAGGVVLGGGAGGAGALPLGRASAGAEVDVRPGPFELRTGVQGRARFANDGAPGGASTEAATAARAEIGLPFARTFDAGAPGEAPLVHVITPLLLLRGALASQRGAFFVPLGGTVPAASWIAAAGVASTLGRAGGTAIRLDARAGGTGAGEGGATGLLHARLGADARLAAAAVEAAGVGPGVSARGLAMIGRLRVGPAAGPSLRLEAAAQGGAGAGRARALAAGAWAALPGDDLAYLAAGGWTYAAEVSLPWTRTFRTVARADADLDARAVLGVRALAEYRHPCGCLGLGITGAHRMGRDGADVAVTVDVMPPVGERR